MEEREEPDCGTFPNDRESGIYEAMLKLPPKYRIVLYLRYYEEYQIKEIAELLRITPNLASARLKRAKAKMKALLSGESEGMSDERKTVSVHVSSHLSE